MSSDARILTLEDIRAGFSQGTPRYAHIAGVVRLAERLENKTRQFNGDLIKVALYHDIGYSPQWSKTKFHPVDGAILAREHGLSEDVAQAILHHGGSWLEAKLARPDLMHYYGAHCQLMEKPLYRAFTYCDMHTGPAGQVFTLQQRLDDIRIRRADSPIILQVMNDYEGRFKKIDEEFSSLFSSDNNLKNGLEHAKLG